MLKLKDPFNLYLFLALFNNKAKDNGLNWFNKGDRLFNINKKENL